jgi:hypothetical protein
MLKLCQSLPDGARKEFYNNDVKIINNNHAIITITKCPTLEYYERKNLTKDIELCYGLGGSEDVAFASNVSAPTQIQMQQ